MKLTLKLLGMTVIAVILTIAFGQNAFIYPGAHFFGKKENYGIYSNNIDIIQLTTEDGKRIELLKLKQQSKNKRAILVFHGNADTASNMLLSFLDKGLMEKGFDIFALEYRGYSEEKAKPTEIGLYLDAKEALKYLKKKGYKYTVYYGHSLGTGVAVNLLREETPDILILESPFTNLAEAAKSAYPFIPNFIFKSLLKDKYDSTAVLSQIEVPYILIMHGQRDRLFDVEMAKKLYETAKSPNKKLEIFEDGEHNDLSLMNHGVLNNFISEALKTTYIKN